MTALTGSDGQITESYTYDIYGQPKIFDAATGLVDSSPSGNRFLFTGREWFAALSLLDNRHRYYRPEIGRWLSRDPIEEEGGLNLYGMLRTLP